jgi:hypothetical protein
MFPALQPLFSTVFKIRNRNAYQILLSSMFEKHFPFSIRVLETARSQLELRQESMVDELWWRCLFLLKTATLEAMNVLVRCCGEESMSNLHSSPRLHLTASISLQDHVECLINSGPFKYKFKVDDIPDIEKADKNCFDLGLLTSTASLTRGNSSIFTPWTSVWPQDHTDNTMFCHCSLIHLFFSLSLFVYIAASPLLITANSVAN